MSLGSRGQGSQGVLMPVARAGPETAMLDVLGVCRQSQRRSTSPGQPHRCYSALHPQPRLEWSSCRMPGHRLCERHMRRLVLEDQPRNYPPLPTNSIHVSDKPSQAGGAPAHRHLRGGPGPADISGSAAGDRSIPATPGRRGPSLEENRASRLQTARQYQSPPETAIF